MSATPVRFLFDTDFGAPKAAKPAAPTSVALDDHEAALSEAEASGYRRGEADGRRASREADAARLTSAVETLGGRLAVAIAEADARSVDTEREAVALALAFAKRLSAAAVSRFPLAEIEAAAEACFAELRAAPHLVARVAPDFVEAVKATLGDAAQQRGFAGRIIVLGDPDVAEGDARLEWADGGVVRDAAAVEAAIHKAVEQRFEPARDAASAIEDDQGTEP
ncbi:FliH/SctL family protein [Methylopila sp. M107]|uniref:FliH/SctL family protein n=1 Tax=Methylopila sp. M107 TaxID=1101190 RepID=UPI0003611E34|nr:FliH/SctL family protein [Methylopila sp. M107]